MLRGPLWGTPGWLSRTDDAKPVVSKFMASLISNFISWHSGKSNFRRVSDSHDIQPVDPYQPVELARVACGAPAAKMLRPGQTASARPAPTSTCRVNSRGLLCTSKPNMKQKSNKATVAPPRNVHWFGQGKDMDLRVQLRTMLRAPITNYKEIGALLRAPAVRSALGAPAQLARTRGWDIQKEVSRL